MLCALSEHFVSRSCPMVDLEKSSSTQLEQEASSSNAAEDPGQKLPALGAIVCLPVALNPKP